jgi:hypothetical protein
MDWEKFLAVCLAERAFLSLILKVVTKTADEISGWFHQEAVLAG